VDRAETRRNLPSLIVMPDDAAPARPGFCPGYGGTFEGLESAPQIMGVDEVGEATAELVIRVVVKAFDGCVLDGAVHAFELAIGSWMLWLV